MLNRWVRTATSTVERGGHRVGQTIKTLLRPVRTTAALTSAAALDAVRPRSELVAENALLRLQILVLARAGPAATADRLNRRRFHERHEPQEAVPSSQRPRERSA